MKHGGKRAGAGRPAGGQNADTAASRQALAVLMDGHVKTAIAALADIAKNGTSEGARVSAACAILDRTHGRPAQAVTHDGGEGQGQTVQRPNRCAKNDFLRLRN